MSTLLNKFQNEADEPSENSSSTGKTAIMTFIHRTHGNVRIEAKLDQLMELNKQRIASENNR